MTLLGEMFPADPVVIGAHAGAARPRRRPGRAHPRMARALRRARLRGGGGDPPLLHRLASASSRRPAARSSAPRPVGHDGTAAWLDADRRGLRPCPAPPSRPPRTGSCRRSGGALAATPIKGRITLSGYEGSELLVGAPAGRERRGPALRRHRLPAHALVRGRPRLAARPAASRSATAPPSRTTSRPWTSTGRTSPSARRRSCRRPRQLAIPALYFTNLISARPLMGAGRRRLARAGHQRRASATRHRFDAMRDFFDGVGEGHAAGIWEDVPQLPPGRSASSTASAQARSRTPIGEMA